MAKTRRSPEHDPNTAQAPLSVPIQIPAGMPLSGDDIVLIDSVEKKFRKNGFSFEITESELIFLLRSLEFEKFRNFVNSELAAAQRSGSDVNFPVFRELLDRIESIRSYSIRGGKRVYAGYNRERKVVGRKKKEEARGAYYYARDHPFTGETNDVPPDFIDTIIEGDSGTVLRELPDNCIDLILTSPPYNFGLGYDTSADGVDWETYFTQLFAVFDECIRVLKFGGRIIVNIQPLFSDYIPVHHIISRHFTDRKMIWKGEILWEKNNYNCKYCAWGSWKSPSSPYLKYTWEFLEIFAKGDLRKDGCAGDADITAEEFKKWVVAKWSIAPEREMETFGHPAVFPEELVDRALKLFSFRGDIILDPFNGTGTTCVVAKRLNRRYIGIDVSGQYCRIAEERLNGVVSRME